MAKGTPKRAGAKGPAPAPDIYVGLLFVAITCLVIGCSLLAYELTKYEWSFAGG